jgi:hypothetical protein
MNTLAGPQTHPILMFFAVIVAVFWVVACKVGVALLFRDRFRKSTPKELRWASAFIAFMPIWGGLCVYFGHSYLDRAGPVGIWFCAMGAILGFCMWLWVWTRLVSANVSWCVAVFVWVITLWLAFTDRLV